MDVVEIKNHIQTKSLNSFYILTGVEWQVQKIYINMIAQASGKELKYIDSISDVYSKLGSKSFINKTYVYVMRDDKELVQNEKLQSRLESIIGQNILILLLTSPDKRTKFYKTYKDVICDFEPLKPAVLAKYIDKEISLSNENTDKLMQICEYDYGRCLLEIDKIKQYRLGYGEKEIFDNDAFMMLLKEGTIYQPPKDAIFDFIDAVLDRKVNLAYKLYHECLGVGEAVMVMLTVLYNNAKALLQVQSCKSADIGKSTGLTSFQIFGAKKHLNTYKDGELVYIMRLCQRCQQGIVTGAMDEDNVMEYILCQIL